MRTTLLACLIAAVLLAATAHAQTLAIGRTPKAPSLDGKLDEWGPAGFLLGQTTHTLRRPGRWNGALDASAAIYLAWDEEFLYLAADVLDDKPVQAKTGAEPWQGDTLELFFNIHPGQQRTDGFYQIALIPPLVPGEKLRATGPQKDFEGVEGAAVTRKGGYTLECRIPWKNLPGFVPQPDAHLGFQLMLDDRDDSGRKSQLVWSPSAITFNHPMETGTLILKELGETPGPAVVAGPPTEVITDPKTMSVSVMTEIADAHQARITLVRGIWIGDGQAPGAQAELTLNKLGDRVSAGQTTVPVAGYQGEAEFEVQVLGPNGSVLTRHRFVTHLLGQGYAAMKADIADCQKRLAALPPTVDELERGGLALWIQRLVSLVPNEARPDTVSPDLLAQMTTELKSINTALAASESGHSGYETATGSLVRGYRSPTTGGVRGYALYVPGDTPPKAPLPLIVVLHPIFADERYLLTNLAQFKDLGALVYQGAAYRQFDWSGISAAETWAGLDDVLAKYPVDRDRIYLVGIHNGGRGTWQLALARPDLFAAVAPLFSGIDAHPPYPALRVYPELYDAASAASLPTPMHKKAAKPVPAEGLEKKGWEMLALGTRAENLTAMPVWSAYGEEDADAAAERLALAHTLQSLTPDLRQRYAPGAAHGRMPDELKQPDFWRWLLAQRRAPTPTHVKFVATDLRNHQAWWVRVEQMQSPIEPARLEAKAADGKVAVTASGLQAFALLLKNLPGGLPQAVTIDGQNLDLPVFKDPATELHFARDASRKWRMVDGQEPPKGVKRHGLSGPIADYQFGRFLFVYGTAGTPETNAAMEKAVRKMADWGLGAVFETKADKDVTDKDLAESHILAVGTPADNTLLKRAAEKGLPIQWAANSLTIGSAKVEGPGAAACAINPNPLAEGRYLVVITALDPAGYSLWSQGSPNGSGCDWIMGKADKTGFTVTTKGWFDDHWQWARELTVGKD